MATTPQTVQTGSKGDLVAQLQAELNTQGFGPLVEDGVFGPDTKKSVQLYQQAHGLSPDGIVGPKTWQAIQLDSSSGTMPSGTVQQQPAGMGMGTKLLLGGGLVVLAWKLFF